MCSYAEPSGTAERRPSGANSQAADTPLHNRVLGRIGVMRSSP
jgi:hypothetical protein